MREETDIKLEKMKQAREKIMQKSRNKPKVKNVCILTESEITQIILECFGETKETKETKQ